MKENYYYSVNVRNEGRGGKNPGCRGKQSLGLSSEKARAYLLKEKI